MGAPDASTGRPRRGSEYIKAHSSALDAQGHCLVVCNSHTRKRTILTGLGEIPVKMLRVDDRRVDAEGDRVCFESMVLQPYLRQTVAMEELLLWRYLKEISTGDFSD